jgi:hypothetical protein
MYSLKKLSEGKFLLLQQVRQAHTDLELDGNASLMQPAINVAGCYFV